MSSNWFELLLLALGVFAGASSQRITGLGFALVSAPLLVLVAGGYDGVLLANLLSVAISAIVLVSTWRNADLRRGLLLAVPALAAVPLGALTASALPEAPLMLVIGALTVLALSTVVFSSRVRFPEGRTGALSAGAASGFMNAAAGVGGPALVAYAMSTRWDHNRFVATSQLCFLVSNGASIAAKGLPTLPLSQLATAVAALTAGAVTGHLLAPHIPRHAARRAVLALALTGSAATALKGALAW